MQSRDGMALVMKKAVRTRRVGGWSNGRILEALESRVLLTSATLPVSDFGTWGLYGQQKAGTITFGYHGTVNNVSWTNSNGTTESLPPGGGGGSGNSDRQIEIGFNTQLSNSLNQNSYSWLGGINANDDVMAVTDGSTHDLDVLVRNAGSYTTADFAGTWRISAEDYYGFVSVGSNGKVTNGFIFLNNGTGSAVSNGTVTVNGAGQGVLDIVTGFGAGHADFSNLSLDFTMNAHKDVAVANTSGLGNGTDSHLSVMVKAAKGLSTSSILGATWTLSGVNGSGSLTFLSTTNFTGTITRPGVGDVQFGGTYTLTADGAITFTTQFGTVNPTLETLTGRMNAEGNVMSLADVSGDAASDMMVLIAQGSHTPTSAVKTTLAAPATQTRPYTIDLNTLITAANVQTVDGTVLGLKFTKVPLPSVGSLTIRHINEQGVTEIEAVSTSTLMVAGDTLEWIPSATSKGNTQAFDIQGISDNHLSLESTQVFINTVALPTVTVSVKQSQAQELWAGTTKGNGTIVITRAGGDTTQPLTVTLSISGSGVMGTNYHLIGPDGATISSDTPTITIPAKAKSVTLTIESIQDNHEDPTLTVSASVQPDANATPNYVVGAHATGDVSIVDGFPVVTIKAAKSTAQEASPAQHPGEFLISRTGSTTGTLTVNFNTIGGNAGQGTDYVLKDAQGNVLTNTVTFLTGQGSAAVFVVPIDNDVNVSQFVELNILGGNDYEVASVSSTKVSIFNNNRVPTAVNASVAQSTPKNTALSLTFDQLVALTGAAVGSGSLGTLQLKVSAVGKGTLQIMPGGGAAVTLAKGGVISEGDTVVWTPALNATGNISAFTLEGLDGVVTSKKGSVFKVAVGL